MTDAPDALDAGGPHVWIFDVTAGWFEALADVEALSADVAERASGLSDPVAGRRLRARRAALRILLGGYAGLSPTEVRIVTAPGGKPVLVPTPGCNGPLAFSVSHSDDVYGVAIGSVSSIGFDVERARTVGRAHSIAERWFGPQEAASLAEVPDGEIDDAFMRIWTGKEALAKRHGAGLRLMRGDPGELDVSAALESEFLRYVDVGEGYASALASSQPVEDVRIMHAGEDFWTT